MTKTKNLTTVAARRAAAAADKKIPILINSPDVPPPKADFRKAVGRLGGYSGQHTAGMRRLTAWPRAGDK